MNKKANITLYVSFMIMAVILVMIAAVLAPMGVLFNTEMFKAGESIMLKANDSITGIQNDDIRVSVQDTVETAYGAAEYNIDVNANIFRYGWVFVVLLAGIMVFLYARTLVEYGRPGFV